MQNITQQKKTELYLQQYKLIVDSSVNEMALMNHDHRYLVVNAAYCRAMAKPADELMGKRMPDIVDSEYFSRSIEPHAERALAGEVVKLLDDGSDSKGRVQTRELQFTPFRDELGRIAGYLLVSRDVTGLIEAQERSRQLESIADGSKDLMALLGRDFRYLAVNDAYATAFGMTASEMVGKHVLEIFSEEDFNLAIEPMATECMSGGVVRCQTPVDTPAFGRKLMDVQYSPYVNDHGTVEGFVVSARDITERTEMEGQVRKLAQAVEQTSNVVIITDLEANIEYVNPAFVTSTGYSVEEALGQKASILKSEKNHPSMYQDLWSALANGESWQGEFINLRKDGSELVEAATITPIRDANGEPINYLAVKQDVTQTKKMEEELTLYQQHLEDLVEQRTAEADQARLQAENISLQLRQNQDRYAEAASVARLGHWLSLIHI